jgi:hypothetical protein
LKSINFAEQYVYSNSKVGFLAHQITPFSWLIPLSVLTLFDLFLKVPQSLSSVIMIFYWFNSSEFKSIDL